MASGRCRGFFPAILLVLAVGAFPFATSALGETPAKPFRVVLDDNYPPYIFRSSAGELQGILVDQWALWSKRSGVKAQLTATDWGIAQQRMLAGEFDVIDTIFINEKRKLLYDFSPPYARIDVPLFFSSELSGISKAEDVQAFVVAAKSGDNVIDVLRQKGVNNFLEFANYESIILAAKQGQVKVFSVDRPPALYFLNKHGIAEKFRETSPLYSGEFHRAVQRGDAGTLALVLSGFTKISAEEYDEIDRRWLGSPLGEKPWLRPRDVAIAAVVVLGMFLVFALNLVALRRAVTRKTAELRQINNLLNLTFENIPNMLFLKDAKDLRFVRFNRAGEELLGYPREDLLGKTDHDFFPKEQAAFFAEKDRDVLRGKVVVDIPEEPVQTRDKGTRTLHTKKVPLLDAKGQPEYLLGISEDITEQLRFTEEKARMEDQLRQAQKVEAIGRLAGGVAHDFNNLTAIVLGYGEMLQGHLQPGDPARKWAEQIVEAGQRSAKLTRQLLAFSRRQLLQPVVLNLNDLLRDLEKMLGRLIGEDFEIDLVLAENLGRVTADPGQIEQVVMNLLLNARDAMPRGGRLTVQTANVDLDQLYTLGHESVLPGSYVMFSVTDTGCGMDKSTMARLFEPFFTTKEKGKGTGLGLATAYGIVKQSGGYIWASSEPGKGTTFKVYLPRTDGEPAAKGVEPCGEAPRGNGERILVVEDETPLRELCETVLSRLGYRVSAAGNGQEALDLVREQRLEPDLVVTDVVMPGISGPELAARLRRIRPGQRVLFMSGYMDETITRHLVLDQSALFVPKPFTELALATKVREALGEDAAAGQRGRRIPRDTGTA
ncbi:MAG: ATP-binding protein [Candidatus Methylomirabilia bacterium]